MKWKHLAFVTAFLLALALLQFLPFLLGKTLVFGDNYSLMVPGKLFTAKWIKRGALPLWNPEIFAGLPWIQDVNQSVLYPSTIFFLLFPPAIALNITIIVHLVLTGMGAWLLARRWIKNSWLQLVPAVLWSLSTQVAGSIHNLSTIQSITWLPWLVFFGLFVTKRWWAKILFALVVLLQFEGGYPQHVIYSIFAAVLVSLVEAGILNWKRSGNRVRVLNWFKDWAITALLTMLISAVAWLPFAQKLLVSTRTEQSTAQAQVGSLDPPMLLKSVLPYVFDKPTAGMKWGPAWNGQPNMVFYLSLIGLLVIGLRVCSKQKTKIEKFFLIFFVLSLLFSLGNHLPGFELVQRLLPLFRVGRYPSMVLMVTNLFLALWVGISLQKIILQRKLFSWMIGFSAGLVVTGAIVFGFTLSNFNSSWNVVDGLLGGKLTISQFHTPDRDKIIVSVIGKNIFTVGIFLLAAVVALRYKKYSLLICIIGLDLLVHTHSIYQFAPNASYDFNPDALVANFPRTDKIQAHQYRWLTRGSNKPYSDYGSYWEAMIVRQPFSDSFVDAAELQNFSKLAHLRDGLVPNWNMTVGMPVVHGYTTLVPLDYAKLWQQPGSETRINFLDEIDPNNPLLQQWATKYYLVDTAYEIKEDLSSYPLVKTVDQWQIRELPGALPRIRFADGSAAQITAFSEDPNQLQMTIESEVEQRLIVADRYDPDWRATVNGREVPVENHDGMRTITLQPSTNQVRMWYAPRLFYLGLAISSLTVMGLIGGWLIWHKRWQTN